MKFKGDVDPDDRPRVHARGRRPEPRAPRSRTCSARRRSGSPRASRGPIQVDEAAVRDALGPRRFAAEARKRTSDPGVATGLAVTAVGGDVLFIEATAYPGKGRLQITGQLGDVMQESAHAALSWVRSHAELLGIDPEWFAEHDIHIHVPAGAVPKDGPSAGVTMATAIVSLVTGRTVSAEVGMTGEITLTGQVLQIGGVRDKVLAAQRAGLTKVILPKENEADLIELPEETRNEIEFVLADHIDEVLEQRSTAALAARPQPVAERQQQRLLAEAEAADELIARGRLAVRLAPAADELVLALRAQDEGDPVDELAVRDLVLARAAAAGLDRAARR